MLKLPEFLDNRPLKVVRLHPMHRAPLPPGDTLFLHGEGPRSRCYGSNTALTLFVQPYDEVKISSFLPSFTMEHQWNEIERGKPTTRRKTCPSATLSTTNPTWTDP
jgi:hypothetical protein